MTEDPHSSGLTLDMSRAMVAVFKEYLGRGPTKARAEIGENSVLVIFEDTLTKAERSLAKGHRQDLVAEMRRMLQTTFRDQAAHVVEEFTGRRVVAFLSDHDVTLDIAVEVFILAPQEPEGL